MTNEEKILFITIKATLTKAASDEEVGFDVDLKVGCREECRYIRQENVTCQYKEDELELFHQAESLLTCEEFTAWLPIDWMTDIEEGSLVQVRVKGFKTVCSSKSLVTETS